MIGLFGVLFFSGSGGNIGRVPLVAGAAVVGGCVVGGTNGASCLSANVTCFLSRLPNPRSITLQ